MRPRSILTIGLLTVFLLAACAPGALPEPAQQEAPVQSASQKGELPAQQQSLPAENQPEATQTEVLPTVAPADIPQAVATSRGPNLEATDPATVSLASGDIQLVEFFRFT